MNEKKVYQNLGFIDYLFLLIPPLLMVLTSLGVLVSYKITGGGGALGGLPLISAMIFGCVIFSLIAFVSAMLLSSKLVFRIIVGLAALPLLLISFGNLVELFRFLTTNQ